MTTTAKKIFDIAIFENLDQLAYGAGAKISETGNNMLYVFPDCSYIACDGLIMSHGVNDYGMLN